MKDRPPAKRLPDGPAAGASATSRRDAPDSQPPAIGPPHNAPPQVPDYELFRWIGGGSYGEVWLARSVLGTWRAVKIVYRSSFDHDRPFEREFEGIQKFEPISRSHDSQVDILHVGKGDGCFYYVMELADDGAVSSFEFQVSSSQTPAIGQQPETQNSKLETYIPHTLKLDLQRRGRLPPDECVQIGLALTTALAHLHEHGLVHRDVKPSNIIFVDGRAKLADIGLVTSIDATRSFVGTEGYLPSEGAGTPQADLYSLGKVLYEMSTGQDRRHFPALPADVAQLPDARELSEPNAIVIKACQLDPRLRYQSANEMQADLARLQRGESVKAQRIRQRRLALAGKISAAAAVVTLLVTAGWLVSNRFNTSTLQGSTGAQPEVISIAVLPFVNDSKSSAHEYLANALTDEMMNALTNCAGLRVAPRPAIYAFKRTTNDLRQIGEQLGVRTVLAGRMKKSSNQLHIAASLIDVADGANLWSESYDGEAQDLGAIQSEVVRQVARELKLSLDEQALSRMETNLAHKLAAYKLYFQAITNWRNTQDGLDRGIGLLNQAIAEDPNHAPAYAHLAYRYADASDFYLPAAQAMTAAKMNALRALQLDDSLSMAHSVMARVFALHELNLGQAKTHFQRAIELAPNNGEVYGDYATTLSLFGQFKDSDDVLRRGERVDPKDHNLLCGWCWRYYLDRDFEKARKAANRLQTVHPNSIIGPYYLALAHEGLRQYDEALALEKRVIQRDPSLIDIAFLGRLHARLGHWQEAQKALEELRVLSQSPRGTLTPSAEVLLALGDTERAIEYLQRAVDKYPPTVLWLRAYPYWDNLRADPRFQALLKQSVKK